MVPGRNSQLYISKINGVADFVPQSYLIWTFQELHGLIRKENGMEDIKVFFTLSIYQLQKQNIKISKTFFIKSFLCPDCENMELLCLGINNSCIEMN